MGPYVTAVSDREAKILWVTHEGQETLPWLELGEGRWPVAGTVQPIPGRPERLHVVTVDHLVPSTEYDYTLTDGRGRVEGEFTTAPPTGSDEPFDFIVYGDTRSHPHRHAEVIRAIDRSGSFAFVLNTGDLITSGTVWEQWKSEMFDPADPVLRRAAFWPARGNHERDAVLMRALFDMPAEQGVYYSFDHGNVHVVFLDGYLYTDPDTGDRMASPEMLRWLEADLAATDATWIVAAYHEPTFNIGGHSSTWGQNDVLPILERHGVDIVVTGHSHIYERFRPIGPAGRKPIVHIVTGGGGAPTYPVRPSPILEAAYSGLHFCRFHVDGNRLSMQAVKPDGTLLDAFELVKTDERFQPEIMATALSTEEAKQTAFVAAARLWADFPAAPQPGQVGAVNLSIVDTIPAGADVMISSAEDSHWQVEPLTVHLDHATTDEEAEMLRLRVRPPESLTAANGRVEPPMRVEMTVSYRGQTWTRESVGVGLSRNTVRKLTPEPVASAVPRADGLITVDGRLDDWTEVPPLVLPSTGEASRAAKMAWTPQGLYVAFDVADADVQPLPSKAWTADSVELFIEADYARSFDALRNSAGLKLDLSPRGDGGTGPIQLGVSYGRLKEDASVLKTATRRTEGGYSLEAFVPVSVLTPARMAPGTVMGLHFILRDGGEMVEQFADTTGKSGVWRTPIHWGAVRLAK